MHPFQAFISMYSTLEDEDWEKINSCLSYRIVQANRMILKPGDICKNLYFLENGTVRFFIPSEIDYQASHEVSPPSLFTSVHSFAKQMPSTEGIQAIEESYLWLINREDAYKLIEIPAWKNFISRL